MNNKFVNIFLGLLPLIIFLIIWEFFIGGSESNKFFFASPSLIFQALRTNFNSNVLINDIWITGQETTYGFLIGNIVGAFIGLSLWYSKRIAALSKPYIIAIGAIPIFAIAPMMIIWFGTGLFAKVMMAAITTFFIAVTQAYEGARNIDQQQVLILRSFGASNKQVFFKLVVPSSLIWLFNSLKLNVTFALLGAFIGEFISAESGLGYRALKAGGLYNIPLVLASIICMILLAFLLSFFIYLIEKLVIKWK